MNTATTEALKPGDTIRLYNLNNDTTTIHTVATAPTPTTQVTGHLAWTSTTGKLFSARATDKWELATNPLASRPERCTQHPAFEADYCPSCGTARQIAAR